MAAKKGQDYYSPAATQVDVPKTTKAQRRKAQLFVCGAAQDGADARLLLDMLGLL